jgi:glycosyltransferase involved in cell wall biosynthesis
MKYGTIYEIILKGQFKLMMGKKIVYMTGRHPWPPNKGDQLIAYNQIKLLSKDNEVYLISFPSKGSKEKVLEFEKCCREVEYINISKASMFFNALKTFVNKKPFQVNMFSNEREILRIQEAIARINPDIIHVQTIRMAEYGITKRGEQLYNDNNTRSVLDMIDLLSLNMNRRAEKEKGIKKWVMNLEGRLVENYEKKIGCIYDRTIFVSDYDASRSKLENKAVNPNGTYISREMITGYNMKKKKQILFHGNMNYFPNAEGALYFAERIWPEIHKEHPDYNFVIAGRNPGRKIRSLKNNNGIILKIDVKDMVETLLESEIGVYILKSGTGLQNKILEALASGLPVVSTSIALNGIPGIKNDTVMTVDSDMEIIEAVDVLIDDAERRDRLSIKGKEFMKGRFTWQENISTLQKIWNDTE